MTGNANIRPNGPGPSKQVSTPYGDADRRFTVVRVLTDLFINDHGKMKTNERTLHDEVLSGIIAESGVTIRTEVAERLAAHPRPPQKVLQMLVRDEITIAKPLLHHSPALSDSDLIAVAKETNLEHRLAIAHRAEISGPVVAALTMQKETSVLLAIARNLGATIEHNSLASIAAHSRYDNELADALGGREGSNTDPQGQLFWTANEDMRLQILEQTIVSSGEKGELEFAPIRVSGFIERREALEGLAALLTSQRQADFQLFLAQMLGISHRLAVRIASDPGGEPFAIACKAADFPGSAFTTLLLLYNPEVSQSVRRVYALSELYDTISVPLAWHFMEMWNSQDRGEPADETLDLRPSIHTPIAARTGATRVAPTPERSGQDRIPSAMPQKRTVFGRRN